MTHKKKLKIKYKYNFVNIINKLIPDNHFDYKDNASIDKFLPYDFRIIPLIYH